jgi:hypothetical protein
MDHIMEETLNDLLSLIGTLIERTEKLEAAKKEQDDINDLLADQIVAVDNAARFASDEIEALKKRQRVSQGTDFSNDKLAAAVARIG